MKTFSKKILLLGANKRAMFCWAKAFHARGFLVDVFDSEDIPLQSSRYIHKYFKTKERRKNIDSFLKELVIAIDSGNYECLVPVNDIALEVINTFRDEIEGRIKLLGMPSLENYPFSHNKYLLYQQCLKNNIPVPESVFLERPDQIESKEFSELKYPVVIKPVFSRQIIGHQLIENKVSQAANEKEFMEKLESYHSQIPLMIQEKIEGMEMGYNFLAENGKVLAWYFDRHVSGAFGSESCIRATMDDIPLVRGKLDALIQDIQWSGPGMFDIILKGNRPYVLELNGRLWASAELGIKGGVNIPGFVTDQFISIEIQTHQKTIKPGLQMINRELCLRYSLEKPGKKDLLWLTKSFLKYFLAFNKKEQIIEDALGNDPLFWVKEYLRLLKKALKKGY